MKTTMTESQEETGRTEKAMKIYQKLFSYFAEEDRTVVFAQCRWEADKGENRQTPIARLAKLAAPEPWCFTGGDAGDGDAYPILTHYLHHTFLRVQSQGDIVRNPDGGRACFHTGLQTEKGEDIYAVFFRSDAVGDNREDWILYGFHTPGSVLLRNFRMLPEIADYVDSPRSLVFHADYSIEMDRHRILHNNREILPGVLQGNPVLALSALDGAVDMLQSRLKRDPMLASPAWYHNRVQLLLPLCMTRMDAPDAVLVADRDDDQYSYRIETLLTPQTAYNHARVLRPLHHSWLRDIPRQRFDARMPF